ncbi:MAG: hypothetical protein M0Z85_05135 [Gammaproteobacteria bacterium]|nr:hypothetical protein [Gammaproteobacteria bacterium]
MNIFAPLMKLIALVLKIPPINYEVLPHALAPFPDKIRDSLGPDYEHFLETTPIFIKLSNQSVEVLKNVRVKLPTNTEFTPVIANWDELRPVTSQPNPTWTVG